MRSVLVRLCLATPLLTTASCGDGGPTNSTPPRPSIAVVYVVPDAVGVCLPGSAEPSFRQLGVVIYDRNGDEVTGRTVYWTSSDSTIARVDQTGMVRSVARGEATITATVDGKHGFASVTVTSCSSSSGSCPTAYSWDGHQWRLDSGTFGGAIMRALQRTDADNLDHLVPADGGLHLRITNELPETDYLDAVELLAVDHPTGTKVAPDARGKLHVVHALVAPVEARDFTGRDVLSRVRSADGVAWESARRLRDPDRPEDVRDGVILRFPRPAGSTDVHLVLDGNNTPWAAQLVSEWIAARGAGVDAWYDSLEARPALARALGRRVATEAFLQVSVRTPAGWRPLALFWEAGPEVSKRQVVHLDLRAVPGDTVVVRLEAPPAFWRIDAVGLEPARYETIRAHRLRPASALAHDGSDPRPILAGIDHRYLTLETGQWTELGFIDPVRPAGSSRSYLLRSTGWYRIRPVPGAPADVALLDLVEHAPGGISRAATIKLNQAVLAAGSH